MKIEGQNNLALIVEALTDKQAALETRLMNYQFKDNAERHLLCIKVQHVRRLNKHIQAAALSEVVSNSLVIQS